MSMVRAEVEAGIGWVTLNDPDRRNVLSAGLVAELADTFDTLEADVQVNAVVITGAGAAFCAGADLGDLLTAAGGDTSGVEQVYEGFLRVSRSPLPTVAAVNGPAVGAGMNLALACDVRIVADSAWFDTRFLKIGLHPGGGHTWLLNRLVGPQAAAAMVLFGRRMTGQEAVSAGLAVASVPAGELLADVRAFVSGITGVDRELALRTKQTLRAVVTDPTLGHDDVLAMETEAQFWSLTIPSTADRLATLRDQISK